MSAQVFLAVDLGAESGRVIVGRLDGGRLSFEEIHRFSNRPVRLGRHLHWNFPALLDEVQRGMAVAGRLTPPPISLGIDTWGVDFGLLTRDGALLGLPHTYRDPRIEGALESFLGRVPREEVYERTGVQFLPFNSLYQLHAMVTSGSPLLEIADAVLFMPDLLHYFLTGRRATEFTFATTTQMLNVRTATWDGVLIDALGLPRRLFQEIVRPGTPLGPLLDPVRVETRLDAEVVAVGTHDTASAVAAVPARVPDFAFISSGTWSLVGGEVPEPVISPASLRLNFTNEGGVENTFRLLKNVMGLWLIQACRRAWSLEGPDVYARLTEAAADVPSPCAFIDPDDPSFFNPTDMPEAIRRFCVRRAQRPPDTPGEIVRCTLESLALKYRMVLEQMERLRGRPAPVVHVVGGGSRNPLLCQLTANATGRPVLAGPEEATALGNLLVQALASGAVKSLAEGRALVEASFRPARFEPRERRGTEADYARFLEVVGASPA